MTKKQKKTSSGKLFALLVCAVSIALTITLADLFSTALTAGNFTGLFSSFSKISAYNVYAISMFQSSLLSSAEESSSQVKSQSGAGYIYSDASVYYVLASAYEQENDAELVKENLEGSGYTPSIITITIPEISVTSNLTVSEKSAINSALNVFKTTYQSLYDLSVSLDTSIKTETDCKVELSDILSNVNKIKTTFEASFNSKLTSAILSVKLKIDSLCNNLTELSNYTSTTSVPFNSKLKYSYIEALNLNKELCKEINNEI